MVGKPQTLRMDTTTAFDRRLKHVPHEWNRPLVDVIDTFETVQLGLKCIGIEDPFVLIEAVKLVLDRHDKAQLKEVDCFDD